MKHYFFSVLSLLLVVLIIASFCGCSHKAEKTGITLKCALIGYGDYEKLYQTISEFTEKTGIEVEIVYKDNHFALDRKLKQDFESGSSEIDVMSNHSSFMSQYIDYLEPLNNYVSNEDISDFLPRLLSTGAGDGNMYIMPRHADISMLLYRSDLFNDPKNKEAFKNEFHRELSVPKTWDEFEEVALFFGKQDGLYGTAFAGKEEALTGRFYEILQANGGTFTDPYGVAKFNSSSGYKTAKMFQNLYQHGAMPKEMLSYLWDDVDKKFASGELAMCVEWHSYFTYLNEKSNIKGRIGIARMPKGDGDIHSGWLGMHGFSIPKSSRHKKEAFQLIEFLTSKESSLLEAEIGYLPVRLSTWDKIIKKSKHNSIENQRLNLAKIQLAEDSFTPPLSKNWVSDSDTFYPVLQKIILGEIDVVEGLDYAANKINTDR